ncbi:hypothetical protein [Bradyrhizobium sp. CCBAU 53380]|uniref:hypothetical protein n=2 Tax=Bradyrhizobium TaxID=374 RepID=UPI0023042D8C|nr:hypothetical protein [Bradyrhizobium sp. CCBAU 53380]MDA9423648.1 hypothetical protein [Bradyrhizobium sp. CCBAU 53380]
MARQERAREKALKRLARLRREAAAEITRLIAFLDASDPYVMNELEEECEDEGAQCEGGGGEEGCDNSGIIQSGPFGTCLPAVTRQSSYAIRMVQKIGLFAGFTSQEQVAN